MLPEPDEQVAVELLVAGLEVEANFPGVAPGYTRQLVVQAALTKVYSVVQ